MDSCQLNGKFDFKLDSFRLILYYKYNNNLLDKQIMITEMSSSFIFPHLGATFPHCNYYNVILMALFDDLFMWSFTNDSLQIIESKFPQYASHNIGIGYYK